MRSMRPLTLGAIALTFTGVAMAQSPLQTLNRDLGLTSSEIVEISIAGDAATGVEASLFLNGRWSSLDLQPHSVRAPTFRLVEVGADGVPVEVEPGAPRTMRGSLAGDPGSVVAASLLDDGLHARIRLSSGQEFWLQPIDRILGQPTALYALYRDEDVVDTRTNCGANDIPGNFQKPIEPVEGGIDAISTAELGIDADYDYYVDYGSNTTNVGNQISAVINTMNMQYEAQTELTHEITQILVRTSSNQPYTSTDAVTLLTQFRNEWQANWGSIQRDVAQLFTGKEIDGGTIGIAWVGAVCSSYGYGMVQSDFNGNFACATDLSAHELGHNWNAPHCNCTGNTMNPFITCANSFTNGTINTITSFAAAIGCLSSGGGGGGGGGGSATLFADGFESGNFSAGGWTLQNSRPRISTGADRTGTYGARIRGTSYIERGVDTSGYATITLEYSRRTRNMDSGETLTVEWFDGSSWNTVESTRSTIWADQSIELPGAAGNNASFRIRFRNNSNRNNERGDVDDVAVIGS